MKKYLDKTFFKFLISFVIIILISFTITLFALLFQDKTGGVSQQSSSEFTASDDCLTIGNC